MSLMLRRLLSCLAALVMIAAPAATPAQKKAAPADWSRTVTLGANGAYVLGNPKAPTRLVEYLSYTCPHCAHFQAEAGAQLKAQWIKRGLVALEYRNFVRDPFDLSAALLARCGGPARFLANHEALFANHEPWMTKAQDYAGNPAKSSDQVAQLTDIADKTGLFALLGKRGLAPAAQKACIADKQAMSTVLALTAGAWDSKDFSGTPFFIVNGKAQADVHTWDELKPLLPALPAPGK